VSALPAEGPARRRLLLWIVAAAAVVALLVAAGFAWYSNQQVEVRTGQIIVSTDGKILVDGTRTIRVPAWDAGRYTVTRKTVDASQEFSRLFAEAQAALAKGDLAAARTALVAALVYKPGDPTAAAQLKDIQAGKTPKPAKQSAGAKTGTPGSGSTTQPATPGTPKPKPDGQVPVPAPQLAAWIPDTIAGYKSSPPEVDELTVTRSYVPAAASHVGGLVIVVQQFANAQAAQSSLDRRARANYPQDAASQTIGGRPAYFGTDGRRFAVLAINSSGTLVLLEMDAASGGPSALRQDLQSVATALGK
jgi:hypothetical protein